MANEIKACPHCGGRGSVNMRFGAKGRLWYVYVKCDICGATGKTFVTKEDPEEETEDTSCIDAIMAWNMRAPA